MTRNLTPLQEQCRIRKSERVAWHIWRHIEESIAAVDDMKKQRIRRLSKSMSVNDVARKMELDLVLTAAIIERVV